MIERLQFLAAPTSIWLERRGDAAFFMKEYKTLKSTTRKAWVKRELTKFYMESFQILITFYVIMMKRGSIEKKYTEA